MIVLFIQCCSELLWKMNQDFVTGSHKKGGATGSIFAWRTIWNVVLTISRTFVLPHYCGPDNSISRHFLSLEGNSALTTGIIVFVHSSIQALVKNKDKKILTDMISKTNCNYMLLSDDFLSNVFFKLFYASFVCYILKTGQLKSNRNEIWLFVEYNWFLTFFQFLFHDKLDFPLHSLQYLNCFFSPKNLYAIFCRGHQGQEQLCNSGVLEKVKWKHYDYSFLLHWFMLHWVNSVIVKLIVTTSFGSCGSERCLHWKISRHTH